MSELLPALIFEVLSAELNALFVRANVHDI
jgi:hypothetical protein